MCEVRGLEYHYLISELLCCFFSHPIQTDECLSSLCLCDLLVYFGTQTDTGLTLAFI